ncbi:GFA family protein [Bradyrhizobium guangzhouense]|uniref:GFA family protein n=1 Tax=Bradyrhizobium guangzhouense TaxID=1325095 RepID=UPI001009AEAC|nr:GFA family protein [Bradyrhizobium guangzhouense]RXH11970.1 aldehyde-activating protein [Bradyrhizobium guangzhouense]
MDCSGRCACGAVRYTITAEPIRGFQCQCRDCQRDTGTGHSSVFVFPRNALSITGEVREIARSADGGAVKRKGFCPNCGSPIYNKPDDKPEFIGIYVGTLNDASTFKPSVALFCSRGYAWDHLDPDIPKLPEWHPGSR